LTDRERQAKQAEIDSRRDWLDGDHPEQVKPFGPPWSSWYWTRWALVAEAFGRLGVIPPAKILDVGSGTGWTTCFLAESGFRPTGVDIAPAAIDLARRRADRWGVQANFQVGDMDDLELGEHFGAVLVFDALHHSLRPGDVVASVARHLEPGGWVLFGEPSLLHRISPRARRTTEQLGWTEEGVSVRALKTHCAEAGLGQFRRFYQGTAPYEGRLKGFGWEALRLAAANVAFAPQVPVWLAAQRAPESTAPASRR
jgi:2-polyprenyl-3-methyl-5-hydroxy-6-metoxy-1,4-benzoquinol methylase